MHQPGKQGERMHTQHSQQKKLLFLLLHFFILQLKLFGHKAQAKKKNDVHNPQPMAAANEVI